MWVVPPNKLGIAAWQTGNSVWLIHARGGTDGIRMIDGQDQSTYARLCASQQQSMPPLDEQFVRGSELHLWYPQTDGQYGLRLQIQPIASSPTRLVLQITAAIQTSFLDTHPTLDIGLLSDEFVFHSASNVDGPAITSANAGNTSVAVLLGPHDSPFTSVKNHPPAGDAESRLVMFGEFLEKGVIRKARPWFVIDRSGQQLSEEELQTHWTQLSQSPLPLT